MSFWTPLVWILIISPLLILAQITSRKTDPKYLLIFVAYFLLDCYLQAIGPEFLSLNSLGLHWNWSGKMLSLALSLIFILFHAKEIRRDIGFTTRFRKKTLKLGVLIFLGFLLFDFIFKMILFPKGGEFDLESFLFQATIPGITEELVYRGIYFWLLGKAFISSKMIKGVPFGWSFVIVTFLFGMAHGIYLTKDLEFQFDIVTILYLTLIPSLGLGILRKFSGNLVLPVIGHNIINTMNIFIRML